MDEIRYNLTDDSNKGSVRVQSNIVTGKKLRNVQGKVLEDLANAIVNSMGPVGSNTMILRGNSDADLVAEYTKDGNKIIRNIHYLNPIEAAIKSEIENATSTIEKKVGDGTSTVVLMSHYIFDALRENEDNLPKNPYEIIRLFKKAVARLSEKIREQGKECDIDTIRRIAYIATNGNDFIADTIKDIYEEYGMDIFIDVSASTDENTYVRSYDGVTLDVGYADPSMINNIDKAVCTIHSSANTGAVRVYHFQDPIDTVEMNNYFMKIIEDNIMTPASHRELSIPTVILAPKLSRDTTAYMRRLVSFLHQFPEEAYSQKPQILIVTNYMGLNENYVDHISQLCGCKPIRKYIDDDLRKKDVEAGLAPTLENVTEEFCGYCGLVEASANNTKFVDPVMMYETDDDGNKVLDTNGKPKLSTTYQNIINFLKAEYKNAKETGSHAGTLGSLKRQLNAIESNMVEIFVGGISISDRDSLRDLVEDAVLNCRSAAANGWGLGANVMGYIILGESPVSDDSLSDYDNTMNSILYNAYTESILRLYETKFGNNKAQAIIDEITNQHLTYDLQTDKFEVVPSSIETEPAILDTIAKIIGIMFTANQALLQTPTYADKYR